MTRRDFESTAGDVWTKKKGFRNFTWTREAICEWEDAWNALWRIGVKWEWQNADRYARQFGEIYNLFAVHNDAERLDMAIPLPSREIILGMHEYLLDLPTDDYKVDDATNLISKWIKNHV